MNSLTRWEPYRELATMRQMMDRLLDDDFFKPLSMWDRNGQTNSLALDVAENEDAYVVRASLPGVSPEDVEVTLTDNVLSIRGESKEDKDIKQENYHLRERSFGSFARSVTLPNPVNADQIEAVNENGVLTLTLPKAESAKPRKIEVKRMINSSHTAGNGGGSHQ
jgi:HSP20 family protein